MLNHMGESDIAAKIKKAYNTVLGEGRNLTRDLGGTANTQQFTDAIIEKL